MTDVMISAEDLAVLARAYRRLRPCAAVPDCMADDCQAYRRVAAALETAYSGPSTQQTKGEQR